jgi:alkylhydroperoxidase family enzyme
MTESARLPIRKPEDDARLTELFAKGLRGPNGEIINIFGALGNHPDLLKRWLVFAGHVMSKNTLSPRDRELIILRTGWNCRSRYEWGQHVLIALECNVSEAEIEAVKAGPSHPSWSAWDALLLRAADELHETFGLSDATWAALAERSTPEQMLDTVATVGQYHLVAMFLNSLRVPLDPGVPDVTFPS